MSHPVPAKGEVREAFEAWYRMHRPGYSIDRLRNGDYTSAFATFAWNGWQAASALHSVQIERLLNISRRLVEMADSRGVMMETYDPMGGSHTWLTGPFCELIEEARAALKNLEGEQE